MPRSKRDRPVHTSKTRPDRKALVRRLHANITDAVSRYRFIWVFSVSNMRNSFLKQIRADPDLDTSRLFMGKTKVMAVALGSTPETEAAPGTSELGKYLRGEVGLLFTDKPADAIQSFFDSVTELDFARSGAVASRTFVIPRGEGELRTAYGVEGGEEDPIPLAIEPQLRKLGVPTKIVKGKVVLEDTAVGAKDAMAQDHIEEGDENGYLVCREGETLDPRQTNILKIFGVKMAEFRVGLMAMYDKDSGTVAEVEGMEVDQAQ